MIIQLLETRRGSDDGHVVRRFYRGQICGSALVGDDYISDSLARDFLRHGYARLVSCRRLELPEFLRELKIENIRKGVVSRSPDVNRD